MQQRTTSSGLRFLENLAYLVPRYETYRQRNTRMEEDLRLRSTICEALDEVESALTDLLEARRNRTGSFDSPCLSRSLDRLRRIRNAVRSAPFPSEAFFEVDVLQERTIETLLEADLLILDDLRNAKEGALEVSAAWSASSLVGSLEAVESALARLEAHVMMREKTIAGAA